MTDDVRGLYAEAIREHSRQPHNVRRLSGAARVAEGHNPLCGDRLTVYVDEADDVLRDVAFEGAACAIATASASMMTDAVKGRSRVDVGALALAFDAVMRGDTTPASAAQLGEMVVFAGVRGFPSRVRCAVLAWQTLQAALSTPEDGGRRSV
ncbi:MAG: SUF system NifU family Fe-S cluster assembly protein [Candidatus Binatia bacterium]